MHEAWEDAAMEWVLCKGPNRSNLPWVLDVRVRDMHVSCSWRLKSRDFARGSPA